MSDAQTVLLVDDDREVVRGVSIRLHAAGYTTMTAENGQEGVDIALQSHPDVIVLDVRMPQMDGLEALAELQDNEATKNIPIVMLSASIVDQQAALEAGARFYLTKPYQGKELVAALQAALEEKEGVAE